MSKIPSYLAGYEKTYAKNPRQAALEWFRNARFGLFLHYGLYSQLGRGEWVMLKEAIPVAEYEKLKENFRAENFNAGEIVRLAKNAEMKYINITTRHHDSFCLFRTDATDFNVMHTPCKRDLVAELAAACEKEGLGLFLYYSYAADWRHPYFYPRTAGWSAARPDYQTPEPTYKFRHDGDFRHYVDFMHAQIEELLTNYGPVAGFWLDPIMGYYMRRDLFPIDETYTLIRRLQPQCLISFKQGANGDEDFAAPEHKSGSLAERLRDWKAPRETIDYAEEVWEKNRGKHGEICTTLHPWWGYFEGPDSFHRTPTDVLRLLGGAAACGANLNVNTGPLPDGSIHPTDEKTLLAVGEHVRQYGFPEATSPDDLALPPHGGPAVA